MTERRFRNYRTKTERAAYRAALIEFLLRLDGSYLLTLNPNHLSNVNGLKNKVDKLLAAINEDIIGPEWGIAPDRTKFIGVVEHLESNIHVHGFIRFPEFADDAYADRELIEILQRHWRQLTRSGTIDMRLILSSPKTAASYITKDFLAPDFTDRIIIGE